MSNVIDFQNAKDKRDVAKNNIIAGKFTVKIDRITVAQLLSTIKVTNINGDEQFPGYFLNGDDKNAS